MLSLRVKLMLVVLVITVLGLGGTMLTSLKIVSDSNRGQLELVDKQVSELVSKNVIGQLSEYRRRLEILFKSHFQDPEFKLSSEIFPELLWVEIIDVTNKSVFSWSHEVAIAEESLSLEQLIGYKKKEELSDEVRSKFADKDRWVVFNSTVKTLFPTFLLGTTFTTSDGTERRFVVLAELQAEKLYSTVEGRKGQEVILIDSHQNILLSTKSGWDPSQLVLNDAAMMKAIEKLSEGQSSFTVLLNKAKEEMITSFIKSKEGGGIVLILQEPMASLEAVEANIRWRSIAIMTVVMIIMLNLLFFFSNGVIAPLTELAKMMEKVGKGEFTGKIKIKARDEIGRLADVFNKMIQDLKEREAEIGRAKGRLIQSEKMSAFGQMSAGIAHEVKNPLAGILGYTQMSKKKLPTDSEVVAYLDIIERETVRCKEIVENLMKFARQEKAVMGRIDINKTIKDSIRLVEHQMSISGIKIVQVYALDGAPILMQGNSNQIQQVMMNLMLNSQQAMENKGTLTITTHFEQEANRVIVLISDTGCGMAEDVKHRVFEPFYTTKGVGKGTGLGLSVSLGIIKDHGGSIEVESEVGKGTTFQISLPCNNHGKEQSTAA